MKLKEDISLGELRKKQRTIANSTLLATILLFLFCALWLVKIGNSRVVIFGILGFGFLATSFERLDIYLRLRILMQRHWEEKKERGD